MEIGSNYIGLPIRRLRLALCSMAAQLDRETLIRAICELPEGCQRNATVLEKR